MKRTNKRTNERTNERKARAVAPTLPSSFSVISGELLVKAKAAAKLSGIAPVALEVAHKLMKEPSVGAAFSLGDPQMKARATEIEAVLVKDIRRVVKALSGKFRVKSTRDADKLIFWVDAKA